MENKQEIKSYLKIVIIEDDLERKNKRRFSRNFKRFRNYVVFNG